MLLQDEKVLEMPWLSLPEMVALDTGGDVFRPEKPAGLWL